MNPRHMPMAVAIRNGMKIPWLPVATMYLTVRYMAATAKAGNDTSMPPEMSTSSTPRAMMPMTTLLCSRLNMFWNCQKAGLMRPMTAMATTSTTPTTTSAL